MSTQIAVRLPEDLVEELDRAVSQGEAKSRTELVISALERELRRLLASRDAQILMSRPGDDLDTLVDWSSSNTELELEVVREICLARLDKTRPVLVLTRELARDAMTKVTVAPITTTVRGLSSEVELGRENGLDQSCVVSIDNTLTIRRELLGRSLGILLPAQELALARAIILAFDLDVPLSSLRG